MTEIICTNCGEVQSDCTNGGDPGPWWGNDFIPDGEVEHDCYSCDKPFIVVVDWTPSFSARKVEDEDS